MLEKPSRRGTPSSTSLAMALAMIRLEFIPMALFMAACGGAVTHGAGGGTEAQDADGLANQDGGDGAALANQDGGDGALEAPQTLDCDDPSGEGGGGPGNGDGGSAPTIWITSPAAGATVSVVQPPESPAWIASVGFSVTNFTIWAPGTCPGGAANTRCGYVVAEVDGTACNQMGETFNSLGTTAGCIDGNPSGGVYVNLADCSSVDGPHTVTLELHADDGSPIVGPNGAIVSARVTFKATGA
jgi:hypothetical protein